MPSHRLAALESRGRVVLAALGERSGDRIPVVTEEGAAFDYPADRVLWTARRTRVQGESRRDLAAALRVLRAGAAAPPDWAALREKVPAGVPLDPQEIAGGGDDAAADARALAIAARAHEAAPHFRLDHGRLVAVTEEELRAERDRRDAERRAKEAEDALVAALKAGGDGPPPETARPALDALLLWALGPADAAPPALAGRLGLADVFEGLERLEAAGLLPADAVPPLSRHGIARGFPRLVRDAAAAAISAPDPAAAGREDLREVPAYAVDDPETSEVDDAVAFLRGPGGEPRMLVHISDAAAAVESGGALDLEARRRATTVYLPDLRVPMMPEDLTAARLSLEAGADRPAVSMEVRLGADGTPEAVRIFRSLVRVERRLDYEGTAADPGLPEPLRPLLEMAREMRRSRIAAGARVLEAEAAHLRVRGGRPVLLRRSIGGAGDVLVGEAMIAFNRLAAERLRAAGAPALWRTQEPPRGEFPPREDPLFVSRARRLFSPVRVAMQPGRHEGLGVPCYLQATSPIRRYADLLHQRQLVALLEGRAPPHSAEDLKALAADLAQRERLVRTAETEREDYWMCVLLEARREEAFEGVVARAPVRGRGYAWIPALFGEFGFRWPKERADAPAEGAAIRLRPGRLAKHRGRIEFDLA
jgi:exoribonuclease-2